MSKKRSTLYLNGEAVGNGGTRYAKGTQPGVYSPVSQENVHLTPDFSQFIPQLMGSVATIINPNADQASQYWLYNTMSHYNRVYVIRDSKGDFTTYANVQKENTITNGVYSVAAINVEGQVPTTAGVPAQWVPEGDDWRYWDGENFVVAKWVQSKGYWYYLRADGYMETGWLYLGRKVYYLKTKAEDTERTGHYGYMMSHRWCMIDDTWYYFHTEGSMLIDGWRMDAAQKKWYYCGSDGKMVISKIIHWKHKDYYVGDDGAMVVSTVITDPETKIKYKVDGDGVLTLAGTDIINYTEYDMTLDEFLAIQMKLGPTMENGKRWKTATKEQVIKYLDPDNYMKEPYNYQFLDLSAPAGISEADMKSFLNGKGVLSGQEDVYLNAAQKYNISEVYLAAHSALETANGTSQLATGLNVKGVTVYNMYGIGAVDGKAIEAGKEYAYKMHWDSVEKAIDGGAKWISEQYINNSNYKQDTLYKMRWNPGSPGKHQYATAISWATSQTASIKKMYDQFPNATKIFDIPKYNTGEN